MEESNVTIRKRCATDETPPPLSKVSSRCCWQSVQTNRKTKTDEHGLCKLVGSSGSRKLCSVHWSVLFKCSSSHCFIIRFHFSPIQKPFPQSFLLPLPSPSVHTLTHPQAP